MSVEQADCPHCEDGDYLQKEVAGKARGDYCRRKVALILAGLGLEQTEGDENQS